MAKTDKAKAYLEERKLIREKEEAERETKVAETKVNFFGNAYEEVDAHRKRMHVEEEEQRKRHESLWITVCEMQKNKILASRILSEVKWREYDGLTIKSTTYDTKDPIVEALLSFACGHFGTDLDLVQEDVDRKRVGMITREEMEAKNAMSQDELNMKYYHHRLGLVCLSSHNGYVILRFNNAEIMRTFVKEQGLSIEFPDLERERDRLKKELEEAETKLEMAQEMEG